MYKTFFNLKSKPFDISTDPIFLWLGENYKEALSTLRYGIQENKGFLLLTGNAGTGKTTLINALTKSFDSNVLWAVISDPKRERLDFYNAIARGFGITKEFTSKVQFLIQFSHFLHTADDGKKKVLLLIDECHLLSQEMLEELRLLSNIEKEDSKLINIFFVGQNEFQNLLIQPNNLAVRQRLALKVALSSLTAAETEAYIRHRLKIAGTEEKLFSPKALKIIHHFSQGIPRQINIICEHTLVAGSVQCKRSLDHKIVQECIEKLNLPLHPGLEDFDEADLEKRDLDSEGVSSKALAITFEADGSRNWLKYAVGGVAVVLAVVYLWYPGNKVPGIARIVMQKAEQPAVIQEIPQVRSPAVTVLGENLEAINEKKAAELKHTILVKAASLDGDTPRQGAPAPTGKGDVEQPIVAQAILPAKEDGDSKIVEVGRQIPLSTADEPGNAGEKVSDMVREDSTAMQVAASRDQVNIPALPNKIVLPLAPNSSKLTGEAIEEYEEFIGKLKFYPRAKLLVKGFVSSNSDSPENTKLSEERAVAVQKLLVVSGIETERVQVKGMGNQEPIATNNSKDGRTKNRRVEIVVVEKE
ncbi:MAG: AAA family ATPase [Pseudomonadota bacterium]